ncbi:MAG: hypothetical protein JSU05_07015, partial [Bacteroidetes bacterium]|nr:hypothetical protein [Bacteroidota bacterium]
MRILFHKIQLRHSIVTLVLIAVIVIPSNSQELRKTAGLNNTDSLAVLFKVPPRQYSVFPFWSLNNTLDTAKMNWQIDQMVDKGVYGAFMHAREGLDQSETPYFSEGWWNAIESTVKYAHQKNFFTNL